MDIMVQMVAEKLNRGELAIVIGRDAVDWMEKECMAALGRIREILADDRLEDPECFDRIERIVCEMESLGLDCGTRHDFG